jgi:hypothetical protein
MTDTGIENCSQSKPSFTNALSGFPYFKCFIAERGKDLNCRIEEGHKNGRQK